MTKQELINAIQQASGGMSKANIETVLNELGSVALATLSKGEEVTLPLIGKLSVKTSAARTGRNPATGAEIQIPAKNKPHFSAAKALKDAVNEPQH